jgi:hypothetical protein
MVCGVGRVRCFRADDVLCAVRNDGEIDPVRKVASFSFFFLFFSMIYYFYLTRKI